MMEIPKNVGGRFSVLSPAGLLPAALIEIEIEELLKGAKNMRNKMLSINLNENLPYRLAVIQYLLYKKGKTINVMMPYSQKLFYLSDWYRQLLAESIGKNLNTGITPVKALGVTDQHSQSQLYNDGPNDKLIIFIETENFSHKVPIPNDYINSEEVEFLKNADFNTLIKVEKQATEKSLTKNDRPNITLKIKSISEESIGEMIMLLEGSVAFLGELFNINAFDQPGVELSKKLTKEILKKNV